MNIHFNKNFIYSRISIEFLRYWNGSHSKRRNFVTVFYSYANWIDDSLAAGDAVNTVTLIDVIFSIHISMIIYLTFEHFNSQSLVFIYKNVEEK